MRVVLFISRLFGGGAERQMSELATALAKRGHDVVLLTLYPGGRFWDLLAATGEVQLESLRRKRRSNRLLAAIHTLTAFWPLRKAIRRRRPCIVYSMLYISNVLAWLAAFKNSGTRLVWGIRSGAAPREWTEVTAYRTSLLMSGRVSLVVFNSEAVKKSHERAGFRHRRAVVVPNGINTHAFRRDGDERQRVRNRWGIESDILAIGVVGRLHPCKGHRTLIEAARIVTRQFPECVFVIVGDGELRQSLQDLVREVGLDSRFRWLGYCNDMPPIYSALDLLVSSSWAESHSNVIGEAMACEVPCVVTDVGDSSVIVGPEGIVVPPRDSTALADGILRAKSLDLQELGLRSRDRIARKFALEKMVSRTEEVLRDLHVDV